MIEVCGLSKRYGELEAVSDLSFAIDEGEIVGLLGPNGAGKSTTMRMLTTFLAPSSGSAKVAGFDIVRDSIEVRRNIGYLPEVPALYPEMRVGEYLSYLALLKGLWGVKNKSSVEESIECCGLEQVSRRPCSSLSRGYRQRVGLAAAMVSRPKVLILDEPTGGLDPEQIVQVRNLIRSLKGRQTVLLSTHILPEVSEVCSSALIIAGGRLVVGGPVAELTRERSLEERYLAALSAVHAGNKAAFLSGSRASESV